MFVFFDGMTIFIFAKHFFTPEQIGGLLRVKSAPDRGTTVTLELPLPAQRSKRPLVTRESGEPAIA